MTIKTIQKEILISVAVTLVLAGGAGYILGQHSAVSQATALKTGIQGRGTFGPRGGTQGGFVTGDVVSLSSGMLTLKMRDGGSKVVVVASSTKVLKSTEGTLDDVVNGGSVMVVGKTNSDGSITAESIQLRGAMMMPRSQ